MSGTPRQSSDRLEQDIAALADASRGELVDLWEGARGRPPPKGISRRLLERSAAYELQVSVFGGLQPRVRKKLMSYLSGNGSGQSSMPCRILTPGTRLVREWNGRSHTVEVIEEGFVWNGKLHKSLSAVARAITGARWSGPRFFGL